MPTDSLVPGARSSPASDHELRIAVRRARRAILVVDEAGDVKLANSAAHDLFGYGEPDLVGASTALLIPGAFRASRDRRTAQHGLVPADATPITHHARRCDGSRFAVHVSRKPLHFEGAVMLLATVQPWGAEVDAGVGAAGEGLEQQAQPAATDDLRRLDDLVLQDLTVALWGLDAGDVVSARSLVERALEQARQMQRILAPATEIGLEEAHRVVASPPAQSEPRRLVRVVLADDTVEIRAALRRYLDRIADVEVVGEAVDGAHAVDVVRSLQPDLVVLDYSMPVMDGLEALPRVRAAAPDAKVIMLSSYGHDVVGDAAIRGGAIAYVEKGGVSSLRRIVGLIEQHFGT